MVEVREGWGNVRREERIGEDLVRRGRGERKEKGKEEKVRDGEV